jgi:hypothetical protein
LKFRKTAKEEARDSRASSFFVPSGSKGHGSTSSPLDNVLTLTKIGAYNDTNLFSLSPSKAGGSEDPRYVVPSSLSWFDWLTMTSLPYPSTIPYAFVGNGRDRSLQGMGNGQA